jgi:hypothetical protein
LLFELKSAKRIEADTAKRHRILKKHTFKSPDKVKGANGPTADYAKMLQKMIDDGLDLTAMSKDLKRPAAIDSDQMDIDAVANKNNRVANVAKKLQLLPILRRSSHKRLQQ